MDRHLNSKRGEWMFRKWHLLWEVCCFEKRNFDLCFLFEERLAFLKTILKNTKFNDFEQLDYIQAEFLEIMFEVVNEIEKTANALERSFKNMKLNGGDRSK